MDYKCLHMKLNGRRVCSAARPVRLHSSLLGPVEPLFRALSGRLKCTVRHHTFNKDSSLCVQRGPPRTATARRPTSPLR